MQEKPLAYIGWVLDLPGLGRRKAAFEVHLPRSQSTTSDEPNSAAHTVTTSGTVGVAVGGFEEGKVA